VDGREVMQTFSPIYQRTSSNQNTMARSCDLTHVHLFSSHKPTLIRGREIETRIIGSRETETERERVPLPHIPSILSHILFLPFLFQLRVGSQLPIEREIMKKNTIYSLLLSITLTESLAEEGLSKTRTIVESS
jgi:hypothetical protein